MIAYDPKALSREFLETVWNGGDLSTVDALVGPATVIRDPAMKAFQGPEGVREMVRTYRGAFPDLRFDVEEQVAEGDRVVTRWTSTGTHRGQLMGIPPTGNRVTITGITMERFENGRIVDVTVSWDALGLLNQLGVVPERRIGVI